MTLSRRFTPILIVLLFVTGAFVMLSVGEGRQLDECLDPAALKRIEFIQGTQRGTEAEWRYTSRLRQWSAGTVGTGSHLHPWIFGRIVRDFSLFKFWLHPQYASKDRFVPDSEQLVWIDTDAGRLPVHVESRLSGIRPRMVAYAYLYGREPVEDPLLPALRDSFRAVVYGSRPLTLLLISGTIERGRGPVMRDGGLRWLRAAFERYRKVCGP